MNSKELAAEIRQLYESLEKQNEIERKLRITEEEYIKREHPKPKKFPTEHYHKKPEKKRVVSSFVRLLVTAVLGLVMIFSAIYISFKKSSFYDVSETPGTEYEAWLASFSTVQTFGDLEEGWKTVEAAWAERGVSVSWDEIEEVAANCGDVIYADVLSDMLLDSLWEDADSLDNWTYLLYTFLGVIILPLLFVFTRNMLCIYKPYRKEMKIYKEECAQIRKNEERNATLLPKAIQGWELCLPSYRKEYAEWREGMQMQAKEYNAAFQQSARAIKEHCRLTKISFEFMKEYRRWESIVKILDAERASTVEDAINVYNDDEARRQEKEYRRELFEKHCTLSNPYSAAISLTVSDVLFNISAAAYILCFS